MKSLQDAVHSRLLPFACCRISCLNEKPVGQTAETFLMRTAVYQEIFLIFQRILYTNETQISLTMSRESW